MFGVELSKRKFSFFLAPEEIDAQGERAQLAYQSALRDGAVNVYRGRILLIGQDRAGKTSLKKSLIGLPFHPKEKSTEGIEVDSSIFQVDVDKAENWRPIDKSKHALLGCSQDVAEMIVKELCLPSYSHNWVQEEKVGEVKYGSDRTGDCHKNGKQNIAVPAGEKEEDLSVNQVCAQLNPHIYMQYCIITRPHLQQLVIQLTPKFFSMSENTVLKNHMPDGRRKKKEILLEKQLVLFLLLNRLNVLALRMLKV